MNEKRQLEVLYQISRALVGKQSLDAILYQVVQMTADLVGSNVCSLMLLDEKKEKLIIRSTQSLSMTYRNKPSVRVAKSLVGQVVIKKEPLQVTDVASEPLYNYPDVAKSENLQSLLSVPLWVSDEVIGVLNCYTSEKRVFSIEEIQLVQMVANQAAIVIDYVRAVTEETETRLALETKKAVDSAKRVLMKRHQMSEEEAHRFIQKASMERNKPQKEIAEAVLIAADFPPKADSLLAKKA